MARAHQRAAQQSANAWANTNIGASISRQMSAIGPQIKQFAGLIAASFAGREALQAADTWTTYGNSLRVAGLSGENLKYVQEQLYQAATKNGIAVEPLGQLYGRLSQSSKELGANQSQMIKFTEGVTAALRVQGGAPEAASGALMQLSQAMAGGIVRAEEFNSINEGARPILEAVAAGWEKQGMTVSKLRAVMIDGKLTSSDFFESFLRGAAMLEEKAARAPLTVAQSMQVLQNALTKYIGQTNESYGVTDRVTMAIKALAENIDVVAKALVVVGGVYAATFLPALARSGAALGGLVATTIASTAANVANTASAFANATAIGRVGMMATGTSVAMNGLKAAMAFFGGPIGLAITAIGAAVAYLGVQSASASLDAMKLQQALSSGKAEMEASKKASIEHRAATGDLSATEIAAATATARLTGEAHKLKDAYYLAAAAAKTLAVEQARVAFTKSVGDMRDARKAYDDRVDAEVRKDRLTSGPGLIGGLLSTKPITEADRRKVRGRVLTQTDEGKSFRDSVDIAGFRRGQYQTEQGTELKAYGSSPSAPAASDKKKTKKGAKARDNSSSSERAEEQAEKAYHQALHASAKTAEDRHKYALEALEEDKADKLDQLERQVHDKQITAASAAVAKATYEKAYDLQVANEKARRQEELEEQARAILNEEIAIRSEALNVEADALDEQAAMTRDLAQRHSFERQALQRRQTAEDEAFKLAQDQLELDRRRAGWTEEVIKRLRQQAEANHEGNQRNDQTKLDNRQKSEQGKGVGGQLQDYANSFGSLNDQLSNVAKNGIDDLTRGLTDAVMGAKSFKEAFSDMAKSIIAQIIQMAIKFAIFEAIGMAIGAPGLGRAAVGLSVPKNAMGTNNFSGGLSLVGEKGPELVSMPRGSQVVPNNLLRNAFANGMGGGTSNNTTVINNTINAQDAVLTDQVKQWINEGNVQAVSMAQKLTARQSMQRQQNSLVRR